MNPTMQAQEDPDARSMKRRGGVWQLPALSSPTSASFSGNSAVEGLSSEDGQPSITYGVGPVCDVATQRLRFCEDTFDVQGMGRLVQILKDTRQSPPASYSLPESSINAARDSVFLRLLLRDLHQQRESNHQWRINLTSAEFLRRFQALVKVGPSNFNACKTLNDMNIQVFGPVPPFEAVQQYLAQRGLGWGVEKYKKDRKIFANFIDYLLKRGELFEIVSKVFGTGVVLIMDAKEMMQLWRNHTEDFERMAQAIYNGNRHFVKVTKRLKSLLAEPLEHDILPKAEFLRLADTEEYGTLSEAMLSEDISRLMPE